MRWMRQVVASETWLRRFSLDRPLPFALREQRSSSLRYRRPNWAFRPILYRWPTFMRALNSWVLDLRQQRSLRNFGFNILTSRWVKQFCASLAHATFHTAWFAGTTMTG